MTSPAGHPATSITISSLTPLAATVLHCELAAASPLAYQPGQYCMVSIAATARAYSFTAPAKQTKLEFLISTAPSGIASQFWQTAKPGQSLTITGPYGDFVLREGDHRPLLYIAGGVGFAPIRAHLLHLINQAIPRPITLIIGHRSPERMFWDVELAQLAAEHNFSYTGIIGRPTTILDTIPNLTAHTVYICGSAPMCTATAEALYQRGVSPTHVHYELFT